MIDAPFRLVSEATQDRLGRALFELRVATKEYFEAWDAAVKEQYNAEQGPPDAEEDCSDLG